MDDYYVMVTGIVLELAKMEPIMRNSAYGRLHSVVLASF